MGKVPLSSRVTAGFCQVEFLASYCARFVRVLTDNHLPGTHSSSGMSADGKTSNRRYDSTNRADSLSRLVEVRLSLGSAGHPVSRY
jgi:hypothetical protein